MDGLKDCSVIILSPFRNLAEDALKKGGSLSSDQILDVMELSVADMIKRTQKQNQQKPPGPADPTLPVQTTSLAIRTGSPDRGESAFCDGLSMLSCESGTYRSRDINHKPPGPDPTLPVQTTNMAIRSGSPGESAFCDGVSMLSSNDSSESGTHRSRASNVSSTDKSSHGSLNTPSLTQTQKKRLALVIKQKASISVVNRRHRHAMSLLKAEHEKKIGSLNNKYDEVKYELHSVTCELKREKCRQWFLAKQNARASQAKATCTAKKISRPTTSGNVSDDSSDIQIVQVVKPKPSQAALGQVPSTSIYRHLSSSSSDSDDEESASHVQARRRREDAEMAKMRKSLDKLYRRDRKERKKLRRSKKIVNIE